MTFRVIVQPRAEREIREAAFWIREQAKSPTPALRWARGIRAKIETLKEFPHRCPVDPDSAVDGEDVRVLLFGGVSDSLRDSRGCRPCAHGQAFGEAESPRRAG